MTKILRKGNKMEYTTIKEFAEAIWDVKYEPDKIFLLCDKVGVNIHQIEASKAREQIKAKKEKAKAKVRQEVARELEEIIDLSDCKDRTKEGFCNLTKNWAREFDEKGQPLNNYDYQYCSLLVSVCEHLNKQFLDSNIREYTAQLKGGK